jgi:hypothetical protein
VSRQKSKRANEQISKSTNQQKSKRADGQMSKLTNLNRKSSIVRGGEHAD